MTNPPGDPHRPASSAPVSGEPDTARLLVLLHDDEVRARIAAGHLRRLSEVYTTVVRELLTIEPTAPSGHVSGFFLDAYRQGQADAIASVRTTLSAALVAGTPGQADR